MHINHLCKFDSIQDFEVNKKNIPEPWVASITGEKCEYKPLYLHLKKLGWSFKDIKRLEKDLGVINPEPPQADIDLMPMDINKLTYDITYCPMMDTSNVTDISGIFIGYPSLISIPSFNTNQVTKMDYTFFECPSLASIGKLNTNNVISMQNMFSDCKSLKSVEFYGGIKPNCKCNGMFSGVSKKGTLYLDSANNYWDGVIDNLPVNWNLVTRDGTKFDDDLSILGWSEEDILRLKDDGVNIIIRPIDKKLLPINDNTSENYKKITNNKNICFSPYFNLRKEVNRFRLFQEHEKLISIPKFDINNTQITNIREAFRGCTSLASIPQLDTSKITNMMMVFYNCISLKKIPCLNTSSMVNMIDAFNMDNDQDYELSSIELYGGVKPECKCNNMFYKNLRVKPCTLYLDSRIQPNDNTWAPVLEQVPQNWSVVYKSNDVNYKVRILKDTLWLTGDLNLTINGKLFNYLGKGLYSVSFTFNSDIEFNNFNTDLILEGVKIGNINKFSSDELIIMTGDNSSIIIEKTGADILTLPNENLSGWAYDDTVKGIKSNKIVEGLSTTLTLTLPFNDFIITIGLDSIISECIFSYTNMTDGVGNILKSYSKIVTRIKGKNTFKGTTPDKTLKFIYSLNSGFADNTSQGEIDAFWIKKIICGNYPPYPEI